MKVVCFGAMREYLPDTSSNGATIELPTAATVHDLVEKLGAPPRLVHMCLLDGRRVEPDEEWGEDAEVTLMPPFSGGSR